MKAARHEQGILKMKVIQVVVDEVTQLSRHAWVWWRHRESRRGRCCSCIPDRALFQKPNSFCTVLGRRRGIRSSTAGLMEFDVDVVMVVVLVDSKSAMAGQEGKRSIRHQACEPLGPKRIRGYP